MPALTRFIAPALAATLALGAVAPAHAAAPHEKARREQATRYAESHRHEPRYAASRGAMVRADMQTLHRDIDRASARRVISRREAAGLHRQAAGIQRLHASYVRGGLDRHELRTLQRKIERVRAAIHAQRHERDRHRH
ncbi:hypothetical protein [Novosphingobium malaysiense]|uniref:Uncharacterized protein n=1 Tax=Novosphingobium malaysiense TaxID=1348853 RepID=A0A0B1ZT54_9SPHN|nr:hypothetical protein [Novosphingobium malaysiense]KHK92614.1 hypothetical protein LK12_07550 [Novosphingobium malaysiense]